MRYVTEPAPQHIAEEVRQLTLNGGIVAGTHLAFSLYGSNEVKRNVKSPKFWHVYYTSEKAFAKDEEELSNKFFHTESSEAVNYECGSLNIQLHRKVYSSVEELLSTFDFTVSQVAIHTVNGEHMITKHEQFDYHHRDRILHYSNSSQSLTQDSTPLCTIKNLTQQYGLSPSLGLLRSVLFYKTQNSPLLKSYTADGIIANIVKAQHAKGVFLDKQKADFSQRVFDVLFAINDRKYSATAYNAHRLSVISSNRGFINLQIMERNLERSIIEAINQQTPEDDAIIVRKVLQRFDVNPLKAPYNFIGSYTQMKFLSTLIDTCITPSRAKVLLNLAFIGTGFMANSAKHLISCSCSKTSVSVTHRCKYEHSGHQINHERDVDAEIMNRILLMHPENPEWCHDVADWFEIILRDRNNLEHLRYDEWDEAIEDNVFNPNMSYALLRQLVMSDVK